MPAGLEWFGRPLSLRSGVQLFFGEDHVVGLGADGGTFAIEDVDLEGFRAVLAAVDGRRTADQIIETLARTYLETDLRALLERLADVVVVAAPKPGQSSPKTTGSVVVVGAGRLATAIAQELVERGHAVPMLDGEGLANGGDRAASTEAALVVCALEGVVGRAILDVNDAILRSNRPALFVTVEGAAGVVGPLTIPMRTACYVCSRLTTALRHHPALAGDILALRDHPPLGLQPAWLMLRIVTAVCDEIGAFFAGRPYPARLGSLLYVTPEGSARAEEHRSTTACPACRGHNRGELRTEPSDPPKPLERAPDVVCDRSGGSRSVGLEEAERRALGALETLGIELACVDLPDTAPEALLSIRGPFYQTAQTAHFSLDRPFFFGRFTQPCYGKGISPIQARCSALYEWFERNLADWQGDRDIIRAPYARVRNEAIDLPFFASGLLPGMPMDDVRRFDEDRPLDWVWGHCLKTGRPRLLPAASVFFDGRFLGSELELPIRGSSGLSAGCSVADATLQGLLEIVERDATHRAMRNGLPCHAIDASTIADPEARALLERLEGAGYVTLLRDVTSDIGIATVEATLVGASSYTHHLGWGFGTHLDPEIAVRRAVTEAIQVLFCDAASGETDPTRSLSSAFDAFPRKRLTIERTLPKRSIDAMPRLDPSSAGVWQQIDSVVRRIAAAEPRADVCAVDLSHPALAGVHVVRSFVSGMLDEVRSKQIHIPDRCRLVPLAEMYLGRIE
jgi:oxazoline/thiazoline synthase